MKNPDYVLGCMSGTCGLTKEFVLSLSEEERRKYRRTPPVAKRSYGPIAAVFITGVVSYVYVASDSPQAGIAVAIIGVIIHGVINRWEHSRNSKAD